MPLPAEGHFQREAPPVGGGFHTFTWPGHMYESSRGGPPRGQSEFPNRPRLTSSLLNFSVYASRKAFIRDTPQGGAPGRVGYRAEGPSGELTFFRTKSKRMTSRPIMLVDSFTFLSFFKRAHNSASVISGVSLTTSRIQASSGSSTRRGHHSTAAPRGSRYADTGS